MDDEIGPVTTLTDLLKCSHMNLTFCVINFHIYVRCTRCKTLSRLKVDKNCQFSTARARYALNKRIQDDLAEVIAND